MDPLKIEEIVDTWPEAERHAFWETVAFKVCDERVDEDDAIASAFDSAAFVEIFQCGDD